MTHPHTPFNRVAGSESPTLWHGVYLGKIANTREKDLWCKLLVPQVMADVVTDWARPMGFDSIGDKTQPAAAFLELPVDGTGGAGKEYANSAPLGWGGYVSHPQGPNGRPLGIAQRGAEIGPGPPVGTIVLAMFIGGDRNHPVYALTSQHG